MRLQDDMIRATRRFDAAGRPLRREDRFLMEQLARLDETGDAPREEAQVVPHWRRIAGRWLVRIRRPRRAASSP